MPLTGIEIFKMLPKTNCGKCGVPTCLAFAMNLASGKAELVACKFVSDETKAQLSEASAPPILPVTIGTGDRVLKVGGETVMFRHEKRFENPPGIGYHGRIVGVIHRVVSEGCEFGQSNCDAIKGLLGLLLHPTSV